MSHIDNYLPCDAYASHTPNDKGFARFEKDGKFYFALVDNQGVVILRSEGYRFENSRDNGITSVMKQMNNDDNYRTETMANGKWILCLIASNHQEVARTCPQDSEAAANAFLPSARARKMKSQATSDRNSDDYLICREYEEQLHQLSVKYPGFISFQHNNGSHYFAWVEGKTILMRSEAYSNPTARDNGIESVMRNWDTEERFSIEEAHGAYFGVLKAGNRQEIARSCPVNSEAEARQAFPSHRNTISPKTSDVASLQNLHVDSIVEQKKIKEKPQVAQAINTHVEQKKVEEEKSDDYLPCDEYKNHAINDKQNNVAFFKHSNGQYYFVVYNNNGSVRLRSEGFRTPDQRDAEVSGLIKNINNRDMYETIVQDGFEMEILKDHTGREVARSCPSKIGANIPTPVVVNPITPKEESKTTTKPPKPIEKEKPVVVKPVPKQEEQIKPSAKPIEKATPVTSAYTSSESYDSSGGGFNWKWLLPVLLLLALLWLLLKGCDGCKNNNTEKGMSQVNTTEWLIINYRSVA